MGKHRGDKEEWKWREGINGNKVWRLQVNKTLVSIGIVQFFVDKGAIVRDGKRIERLRVI
jgi:uncharacterized protein (DUF2249 family)